MPVRKKARGSCAEQAWRLPKQAGARPARAARACSYGSRSSKKLAQVAYPCKKVEVGMASKSWSARTSTRSACGARCKQACNAQFCNGQCSDYRYEYRGFSLYSGLGFPRPGTLGLKPDSALRPGLGTPCNTWLGPTAWERSRFTSRFSRLGQLRRLRDRRRRCVGARYAPPRRALRLRQRVLHAAAPERVARWQAAG